MPHCLAAAFALLGVDGLFWVGSSSQSIYSLGLLVVLCLKDLFDLSLPVLRTNCLLPLVSFYSLVFGLSCRLSLLGAVPNLAPKL